MKRIALILSLLIIALFITSCSGNDGGEAEIKRIEDMPMPSYAKGQTVSLNVYNWGEYISDGSEDSVDVNAEFEKYFNENLSEKYGGIKIKVEYSTYATNEDMYSKLKNSAVSYDIVIPSDYMIEKMKEERMLLSFDTSDLSNYGNIPQSFRGAYYDPDDCFSVPYTYGMMGIIYNKELVDEADIEAADYGWGLMWNDKYAGQILQYNNPRDAFATAMYWKHLDVNSTDLSVWDEAFELLKIQKSLLKGYVNDEIFNTMKTESAAIASYFVGDFLIMADEEPNLDFYYPAEGVNYFVDAMCIPTCSKNPQIAKEYINFMIAEEAAVANATYIGYASPNTAVTSSEEYREAMAEYSYVAKDGTGAYELLYDKAPDVVNAKYNSYFPAPEYTDPACYRSFSPEVQAHVNTLWENLKISGSTEPWIHVTSIAIVLAVVGFSAYSIYVKKKRSQEYRMRDKAKRISKNNSK